VPYLRSGTPACGDNVYGSHAARYDLTLRCWRAGSPAKRFPVWTQGYRPRRPQLSRRLLRDATCCRPRSLVRPAQTNTASGAPPGRLRTQYGTALTVPLIRISGMGRSRTKGRESARDGSRNLSGCAGRKNSIRIPLPQAAARAKEVASSRNTRSARDEKTTDRCHQASKRRVLPESRASKSRVSNESRVPSPQSPERNEEATVPQRPESNQENPTRTRTPPKRTKRLAAPEPTSPTPLRRFQQEPLHFKDLFELLLGTCGILDEAAHEGAVRRAARR